MGEFTKAATDSNFENDVLGSDKPVLVTEGALKAATAQKFLKERYVVGNSGVATAHRDIVATALRMDEGNLVLATDGCSIPTFGAPVRAFAVAYATFAAPGPATLAHSARNVPQVTGSGGRLRPICSLRPSTSDP